jgi:hypothetical protein
MNPDIAMRMREQLITRLKLLRDENRLLSKKVKIIQQRKRAIADEIKQIKEALNK